MSTELITKESYAASLNTLIVEGWIFVADIDRQINDLHSKKHVHEACLTSYLYRLQEMGEEVPTKPPFLDGTRPVIHCDIKTGEMTGGNE